MLAPFFLDGSRGRLFCSLHRPNGAAMPDRAVLCVPPFAEEMNKSRRMFSLLGQQLAGQGVACLLPDLFGSGDSAGGFAEADWAVWLDDLQRCVIWLQAQGVAQLTLLGLRSGALLAMQVHGDLALRPQQIVLWQPVAKGKLLLTQFLRIRLAASLMTAPQTGAEKESTSSLRADLAAGRSVEVAGYELSPALAEALDGLSLDALPPLDKLPVYWLELAATQVGGIAPVGQKVIEQWQEQGATVTATALSGDSFWTTQEIAVVPELITATLALIVQEGGGS